MCVLCGISHWSVVSSEEICILEIKMAFQKWQSGGVARKLDNLTLKEVVRFAGLLLEGVNVTDHYWLFFLLEGDRRLPWSATNKVKRLNVLGTYSDAQYILYTQLHLLIKGWYHEQDKLCPKAPQEQGAWLGLEGGVQRCAVGWGEEASPVTSHAFHPVTTYQPV